MKHLTRKAAAAAASSVLALAGLTAIAPAAHAADTCPSGDLCVFSFSGDASRPTTRIYLTGGTHSGLSVNVGSGGGYAWNNGTHDPNHDHVELHATTPDGLHWKICLHYGTTPTFTRGSQTAATFMQGETLNSVTWRGECTTSDPNGDDENIWQLG
jgi:hypothetical protein